MRWNVLRSTLLLALLATPPVAAKTSMGTVSLGRSSAPNRLDDSASLRLVKSERDKYWLNAKEAVYRSARDIADQHQSEQDRGLRFEKLVRGDRARKWVAITFDDGPHPGYTGRLLDILKRYNVKATFFVVGEKAELNPGLLRREISEGHCVGNHTYDHVSLVKIPRTYVPTEIKACGEVIQAITGRAPHLFRPPGGSYDPFVANVAGNLGYKIILWTDDPGDYASPGEKVIEARTLQHLTNGSVILLHDGIEQTITALPILLDYLKAHGFQAVTIDDMLKANS